MGDWMVPYQPAGAVQNTVTDAGMAAQMTFLAAAGHACGISFKSALHPAGASGIRPRKPAFWAT